MVPCVIYQFWTGDNVRSSRRQQAYENSAKNFNVPVKLLYKQDIESLILPQHPLHPIYDYLSYVHKSDYLRSYFMHFYGGGYADIKYYSGDNNWKQMFSRINEHPQIDIIGQKQVIEYPYFYDIKCSTISKYSDNSFLNRLNQATVPKLLGNSYFIVRPHSKFSQQWYKRINQHCDQIFQKVKANPGMMSDNNQASTFKTAYPIRWQQLQRQIFHPLCCDLFQSGCIDNSLRSGRLFVGYR